MATIYTASSIRQNPADPPIADGAVAVDGGRIVWIGEKGALPRSYRDSQVIDFGGDVIAPGLIDAHVHLGFDGAADPVQRMMDEDDSEQLILMLRSARELLRAGVTTARDLGARNYLDVIVRDAISRGDAIGPRLVTAGSPITPTGGHCWFMGGEADGVLEAVKTVRRHHRAGVDWIKVMVTGGNMTAGSAPWNAQFSREELHAIVSDSHRLGKRVAAHCHGTEGIIRALDAGVDGLEHCSFVNEADEFEYDPDVSERVAASGVFVDLTMNAKTSYGAGRKNSAQWREAVRDMDSRGVRIIIGTDSGIDGVTHDHYISAVLAHSEAGLDNRTVLEAATRRCADALGLADLTGQLEPGLSADLLVLQGDPLHDLDVLARPRHVITRGRRFSHEAVSA